MVRDRGDFRVNKSKIVEHLAFRPLPPSMKTQFKRLPRHRLGTVILLVIIGGLLFHFLYEIATSESQQSFIADQFPGRGTNHDGVTLSPHLPIRISGKDGAPMVLVSEGTFIMGSQKRFPDFWSDDTTDERPQRRIFLHSFYIDQFEVTVSQYVRFLHETTVEDPRYWSQVDLSAHGNYPVVGINWMEADAYCRWFDKRLPTEAEWEKAARGMDGRRYPWGNDQPTMKLANFGQSKSEEVYNDRLKPVGSFEAGRSPYGIHDMAGNVWEWVDDWYDPSYYERSPIENPRGPVMGREKVRRGGSWIVPPDSLKAAHRSAVPPTDRHGGLGFRCAKDA